MVQYFEIVKNFLGEVHSAISVFLFMFMYAVPLLSKFAVNSPTLIVSGQKKKNSSISARLSTQ